MKGCDTEQSCARAKGCSVPARSPVLSSPLSGYHLVTAKRSSCSPSCTRSLALSPTHTTAPPPPEAENPHFTDKESETRRGEAASPELVAERARTASQRMRVPFAACCTRFSTPPPPPGLVSEPPGQVPPKREGHAGQPLRLAAQVLQPGGRHRAARGSPAHRAESGLSFLDSLVPLQVRAGAPSGREGAGPLGAQMPLRICGELRTVRRHPEARVGLSV